ATGKTQNDIAAARERVRTTSAPPFLDTSALAASESRMANSTQPNRRRKNNALRSERGFQAHFETKTFDRANSLLCLRQTEDVRWGVGFLGSLLSTWLHKSILIWSQAY